VAAETLRAAPSRTARLVIVDDHELARAGLRRMLASERDVEVVGEASNGHQAVAVCQRLRPDLVLMDMRMPELDGLAATRAIKRDYPTTSVIIVTMHENPDYLLEAVKAGVAGYVLKGATRRELLTTVRQVLAGESVLQPELATQLLRRLVSESGRDTVWPPNSLTPREREVLQLVAQGQTNHEIARELTLSASTVKSHLKHIIAKLGVSDRTQAAVLLDLVCKSIMALKARNVCHN
jgi:DNA-binding NarL/FixJ family response regulator